MERRAESRSQASVEAAASLGDPLFSRPAPSRSRSRLFVLAIDSKLRGCDVVKIKIGELVLGGQIRTRATVIQQKTGRPVQFELTADARHSLLAWLDRRGVTLDDFAFPSRIDHAAHLSTRQYARLVDEWVTGIGFAKKYMAHTRSGVQRRRSSTHSGR
ncbi:phage integrase family protein [Sphingobium sp. MI1205]|nr:phage integrase family protein [Sphingobium sp. MI1205]